jgi:hypothetical protein
LLDKLIENLIFAMNFDDKVPEHILEEIFRHNKNKNLNTEHESEIQTVDEFNEEVDRKLGFVQAQDDAESLFNEVYGYGDLKFLLAKWYYQSSLYMLC